ncbi:hypothetical protein AAFN86_09695 [Roseomonas sp. CAU 1739]|uniref:hypothetical protein n=1 Tax=Roseomonas sp. CAU 1739 TaxID=3140364 RepID=UPI00325B165D
MNAALNLLSLVLAVGVPAMIALWLPKRWRVAALVLWMLSPAAVLLVLGLVEAAGSPTQDDMGKLVHALLLIGSFLAVPWLLACLAGFVTGGALRKRRQTPTVVAAPPALPVPARGPSAAPSPSPRPDGNAFSLQPPSGWVAAHVGTANDGLVLDGLDIWALPWRPEARPAVALPHPAHPTQMDSFTIYSVDDGRTATRFAAAELSASVWGFYRWVVPADAPEGRSTDGSLRYTHSDGELIGGRRDAVAPTATLNDARTGTLLFDGKDWEDSRVVPQRDGSLLLLLEQNRQQTLFHISPTRRSFRDVARPGAERPLADLAGAAAEAHRESLAVANRSIARRMAPDGSMMVEFEAMEWSNGYWVHPPRVTELATGRRVIDLWRTDWDATVEFPRGAVVRLTLHSYRRGARMVVEVDLATDRYVVEDSTESGPVDELETRLKWAVANVPASPDRFLPPAKPRATARAYGVAFLILAGALVAIGAATFLTLRLAPDRPPVKLDRVPTMPPPPS